VILYSSDIISLKNSKIVLNLSDFLKTIKIRLANTAQKYAYSYQVMLPINYVKNSYQDFFVFYPVINCILS
ncbi:MAG TPA: hypothetical protein VKY57_06630, partial [Chitinispirillaceae bacterium]|nr:hypothetical protein [Chitinispirillaceae bacterium]